MAPRSAKSCSPQTGMLVFVFPRKFPRRAARPSKVMVGPLLPNQQITVVTLEESPGVSGTEFSQLQVADLIHQNLSEIQVELCAIGFPVQLGQLTARVFEDRAAFSCSGAILICSVENLLQLSVQQIDNSLVIAVSHHPHDRNLDIVRKRFDLFAVIHVSRYSYWSNFSFLDRMIFIPNLMPTATVDREPRQSLNKSGIVGYVGALVPAKRFLDLAKAWPMVRTHLPNARLEVLGASSLYGDEDTHPELPTTIEYGNQILSALGVSRACELHDVDFLGNRATGKDEIVSRWQIGVVNPTGNTESFCYSLRELLLQGIPTVGGVRQGMGDVMGHFPGLAVRRAGDIGPTLISALGENFDVDQFVKAHRSFAKSNQREQERARLILESLISLAAGKTRVAMLKLRLISAPLPTPFVFRALAMELTMHIHSRIRFARDRFYKNVVAPLLSSRTQA